MEVHTGTKNYYPRRTIWTRSSTQWGRTENQDNELHHQKKLFYSGLAPSKIVTVLILALFLQGVMECNKSRSITVKQK
jgi:hypothetical protein